MSWLCKTKLTQRCGWTLSLLWLIRLSHEGSLWGFLVGKVCILTDISIRRRQWHTALRTLKLYDSKQQALISSPRKRLCEIFEVMVGGALSSNSMTPEEAYLGKTFFSLGPRMQIKGVSSLTEEHPCLEWHWALEVVLIWRELLTWPQLPPKGQWNSYLHVPALKR